MSGGEYAPPSGSALRDLAETLEMWANMLREHCDDHANGLPSPCLIDDWLRDYRDEWAAQNNGRTFDAPTKEPR